MHIYGGNVFLLFPRGVADGEPRDQSTSKKMKKQNAMWRWKGEKREAEAEEGGRKETGILLLLVIG